jgi:hypothetical protein
MTSSGSEAADWWKIDPDKAEELLQLNAVNRPLRPRVVAAYTEDMRAGLWGKTGETIQISRTGLLLNGQHRLHAIMMSGVTLELLVVTGLADEAQSLMDQGAARSAKDVLAMHGIPNASLAGSVGRSWLLVGEPGPHMEAALKHKASTARILRIVQENPDIVEAAGKYSGFKNYIKGSPSAICYSWLSMRRIDQAACEEFWHGMVNMNFKAPLDPRKATLRALDQMEKDITASNKDKGFLTVSILTRGWNAWRAGEEVQTIPLRGKFKRLIPPVKPI